MYIYTHICIYICSRNKIRLNFDESCWFNKNMLSEVALSILVL